MMFGVDWFVADSSIDPISINFLNCGNSFCVWGENFIICEYLSIQSIILESGSTRQHVVRSKNHCPQLELGVISSVVALSTIALPTSQCGIYGKPPSIRITRMTRIVATHHVVLSFLSCLYLSLLFHGVDASPPAPPSHQWYPTITKPHLRPPRIETREQSIAWAEAGTTKVPTVHVAHTPKKYGGP